MYRYRVIGSVMGGKGKRVYTVLDLKTGETREVFGAFFREKGDDAFINVSVKNNGFNVLKADKGTEQYYKNYRGNTEKPVI